MSQTFEFYDARAREAAAEAEKATLDNVRDRNLRAAKTWRCLADQARRVVAERNKACGPNLIGLRRRSFSKEAMSEIKSLYKKLFMDGSNPRAAAHKALEEIDEVKTEEGRCFLRFFEEGERGFVRSRSRGDSNADEDCDL